MPKENKNRMRRIRNLVVVSAVTAIILSVSTYAWFVGMQTVNVSNFDVEIKTADSLMLSLNGSTWGSTVTINKGNLDTVSYEGHTNSWGGTGLIPMSTIGNMDVNASRMKLFEKASYTPTAGGYRLLASRVNNYETGQAEKNGYVVFDLFIRNFTGTQYIENLNLSDEEAIYLTTDSSVKAASDGVANTGIENSVRVAFAQIGRVIGTSVDANLITSITCNSDEDEDEPQPIVGPVDGVTGICRNAQIWEPNDTAHVANAIRWYTESCRTRTGADVTAAGAYSATACGVVNDGTAYDTYAIKSAIGSGVKSVDIYDGEDYNGYAGSGTYLEAYDYFTDTEKLEEGTDRSEFMYLAPNSVTKVRVYVYIEGQDVDNYDFSTIGKKISVKFGFTKQRFEPGDIDYDGPDLDAYDEVLPTIDLAEGFEEAPNVTMGKPVDVEISDMATYDPLTGVTASDNIDDSEDLDINYNSGITGTVEVGDVFTIKYFVTDSAGNESLEYIRTINVVEDEV